MSKLEIDLKYQQGDYVKYLRINNLTQKEEYGYIVGFSYTQHCYLEKPIVEYALLNDQEYQDAKKSIKTNEKGYSYTVTWVMEGGIIDKVEPKEE